MKRRRAPCLNENRRVPSLQAQTFEGAYANVKESAEQSFSQFLRS